MRVSKRVLKPRYNGLNRVSRWCNPILDSAGFTYDNVGLTVTDSGLLVHNTTVFAGTVSYGSMAFNAQLYDLPNYTDLTNLYEQYRIDKIVFKLVPFATMVTTAGADAVSTAGMMVHYCLDYDDTTTPPASAAGISTMREKQGYRVRNIYQGAGRPIVVTWVPRIHTNAATDGSVVAKQPKSKQWIDTDDEDVPHYGVKFIVESVSPGIVRQLFFKVEAKYYVSLKGTQ